MNDEERKATIQCPGCGRSQEVSLTTVTVDISAPSWQETIAALSVEHTALYDSYRDIAERTETPIYHVLGQALNLALSETRKQHGLCTFCGEPWGESLKEQEHPSVNERTPQFPDGSGWDLLEAMGANIPYFYERINPEEIGSFLDSSAEIIYKIVAHETCKDRHRNTYFVVGTSDLSRFIEHNSKTTEYIVSIEPVECMPSTDEKLM